jgi:hypothetical protein
VELKEEVLQLLAVFLWRSIRDGWMPPSREVIEDGESIFIVFMCYCSLFQKMRCKVKKNFAYDVSSFRL